MQEIQIEQERTRMAYLISLIAHLIILFSIGLSASSHLMTAELEVVVLPQKESSSKPKEADAIANQNQKGAGNKQEHMQYTLDNSMLNHQELREVMQKMIRQMPIGEISQENSQQNSTHSRPTILLSLGPSAYRARAAPSQSQTAQPSPLPMEGQHDAVINLASAKVRLNNKMINKSESEKPVRQITSISTMESYEADYIFNWIKKVETVALANYPDAQLSETTHALVRISLSSDGQLKEMDIMRSSGNSIIDQAVLDILFIASPFDPFTPTMKQHYQSIELIRTWEFSQNRLALKSEEVNPL